MHKKLDGNKYEVEVLEKFPKLKNHLRNIGERDTFRVYEKSGRLTDIGVLETPGHRSDHLSYYLRNKDLS